MSVSDLRIPTTLNAEYADTNNKALLDHDMRPPDIYLNSLDLGLHVLSYS